VNQLIVEHVLLLLQSLARCLLQDLAMSLVIGATHSGEGMGDNRVQVWYAKPRHGGGSAMHADLPPRIKFQLQQTDRCDEARVGSTALH
jgi:hypothetical protein